MTFHEFLVEFYNTFPEESALFLVCVVTSWVVSLCHGLVALFFDLFKPRECVVLVENADGSFSLRVQKIRPAFHRVAKIFYENRCVEEVFTR